jgi:glycosyltransferase involved in cell wall biosynthesis
MVIDGETGLLFEPGNAIQLAQKIKLLANDDERVNEMGLKAHKHIIQLINDDNHYRGLKKLMPKL